MRRTNSHTVKIILLCYNELKRQHLHFRPKLFSFFHTLVSSRRNRAVWGTFKKYTKFLILVGGWGLKSPIDQNSVALSQNTDCKWDKLFILHMFQNVALTTYFPPVMSEVSPIKYIFTLYSADSSKTLKGVQSVWIPKETATLNLTDKRTIYLFTQFPQFLLDKWSLDK